jgi:stage V sporulation protein S
LIASELHQVGCHTDLCLSRIADRWVVVRKERRLTLRNGPCASAWSTLMDRFFSKLDLRDIKIDPERSRFSPDDEFENDGESDGAAHGSAQVTYETTPPATEPSDDWPVTEAAEEVEMPATTANGYGTAAHLESSSDVLKVSSKSRPSAVAGAIAGVVREIGRAEVQAIGAGATNQAIKAVAIARDYLLETGIDAVCLPAFIDITIDNEDRTAIRLVIEPR